MRKTIGALALLAGGFVLAGANGAQAYSLKTLYSFCAQASCADGKTARDGVMQSASGSLYGVTFAGGLAQNVGTVFALVPNAQKTKWTFKQLHEFCSGFHCNDGQWPVGKLIEDSKGNLYGATSGGGSENSGGGTIYELSLKKKVWTFTVLYTFCPTGTCSDGMSPSAGLTYAGAASGLPYDGKSPLYGTTASGGNNNSGVAFSLTLHKGTWTEKVLTTFDTQTHTPNGPLIVDGSGNIFGTALAPLFTGGVVEISPKNAKGTKWKEKVLYDFSGGTDGSQPRAELVMDGTGNLFGETAEGGAHSLGVVFKLTQSGGNWEESVVHDFCGLSDCTDGAAGWSGLALDGSGHLLGAAVNGGGHDGDTSNAGGGLVFSLNGSTFTTLYAFCAQTNCADGEYPYDTPIVDGTGNIFGTTSDGGANGMGGTIFELSP